MTPEEYIAALDEPRRSEIAELDALIRERAPDLDVAVDRNMLGYGDTPAIAISSRARYISLYADVEVAQRYRDRLPTADVGKSCIRMRTLEGIDRGVLAKVIAETLAAD